MSEYKRPEWMQGISKTVNQEDYLLGRKIDKTFELCQQERAEKAKEIRNKLLESDELKLASDPILKLQARKEQIKYDILTNPVRLRQFREFLKRRESRKDDCDVSVERNRERDRHPEGRNRIYSRHGNNSRIVDDSRTNRHERSSSRTRSHRRDYSSRHRSHHSESKRRDDRHRS